MADIQVRRDRTTVQLTEQCATTLGAPQKIYIEHGVEAFNWDKLRASVEGVLGDT